MCKNINSKGWVKTSIKQMTEATQVKVCSGAYATDSEVRQVNTRALEHWLAAEVAPVYDTLKAAPARALSINEVRARLAAEHGRTLTR